MIESMNLIDLYANMHMNMINKKYEEKMEAIRKQDKIYQKYQEITNKCIEDLKQLHDSQFTEKELENVGPISGLSDTNKLLQNKTTCYEFGYFINHNFINDEIMEVGSNRDDEKDELNELLRIVKAHVGIAKTKEEVEEILTRYDIINKKGKLVTK